MISQGSILGPVELRNDVLSGAEESIPLHEQGEIALCKQIDGVIDPMAMADFSRQWRPFPTIAACECVAFSITGRDR
jgi:hypothetical protein